MARVKDDHGRPSPLSGLWSAVVGGLLLVLLLVVLDPITRFEDCPNYGGNGNASSFSNPAWDLYLPLLTLCWVVLVIVEQALPVTWRHRSRLAGWVRAAVAGAGVTITSCCVVGSIVTVCR